ncbi:MAG: tetratricopeptide repeat protein [Coriobacteriales bacterium]
MKDPAGQNGSGRSSKRRRSPAESQRALVLAMMVLIVVILAAVATVIIYGMKVQKAPRTVGERTLATAEAAVRDAPDKAQSWLSLAYAYVEIGRYSAASDAIAKGRKVEDLPDFYIVDAYRAEKAGNVEEAIQLYEVAKKKAIEYRKAQDAKAAEAGARLTGANEQLVSAALGKARLLVAQRDYKSAVVEYDIALEQDPMMADVLVERGAAKAKMGDLAGARADYEEALRYVPGMPEALDGLARLEAGDK